MWKNEDKQEVTKITVVKGVKPLDNLLFFSYSIHPREAWPPHLFMLIDLRKSLSLQNLLWLNSKSSRPAAEPTVLALPCPLSSCVN